MVGLTPSQADQLVSLVQRWIEASGEEWTVERLKAVKVDLLRHFAGLPPLKTHSWIRYRAGVPSGPLRPLFLLSKKKFRTAWNAVMIYTGIMHSDPKVRATKRQWDKMVSAIQRRPLSAEDTTFALHLVHESPFFVPIRVSKETGDRLMDYNPSPKRRSPKGLRTVPEIEGVYDSRAPLFRRSSWTAMNWDILGGVMEGIANPLLQHLEVYLEDVEKSGGLDVEERPEMGLISLIPEGGYKLRFAANPYRVYQQALAPLGRALFDALKLVPNDFTFDQGAAIPIIQRWLGEGRPAWSMDLSNATDNFPLDPQLELLSRLGVSTRWLQFFRSCCRGDWSSSRLVRPEWLYEWQTLRWSTGTPLGLYPTFASFALTHHSVAQWAGHVSGTPKVKMIRDGVEHWVYPYVLLGDDFATFDSAMANAYVQGMSRLGVPISEHKSLAAEGTAEFIGRVITPNTCVQGFKWKGRQTDESFVDFARMFGPAALLTMTRRQRRVISYIADLPEPYGLGWNPLGIPLRERLTPAVEAAWSRDERVRVFSRRAERAHRLLYSSEEGCIASDHLPRWDGDDWSLDSAALSSDQEDNDLLKLLIPGLECLGVAVWPNLPEIVAARQLSEDHRSYYRDMLRRTSHVETRVEAPTLVLLERKVRRSLALWQGSHAL